MTLLDRYILTAFGRIFFLSLAGFTGLYLLVDFFERVDNFISHQADISLYFLYFSSKLPLIMVQVLPLAILMGVFMTLGGLSRTSEMTAIRAGGISLWRITAPLLLASLGAALVLLAAGEFVVPLSARTMNHVFEVEVKGKPELDLRRENLWFREGDAIVHIRLAVPEDQSLEGISIFHLDDDFRLLSRIDARDAVYSGREWLLRQVTERPFIPATGEPTGIRRLPEMRYPLAKTPADFALPDDSKLELGLRDLHRLIRKLQAEGYDATRYRVDLQARLATPFACVILAFLGIPFALQKGRSAGLAMGIAVSVAIGVAYFILQAMLQAFGYSGVLPPPVAAWAANLLFGMLGVWLLLSVRE